MAIKRVFPLLATSFEIDILHHWCTNLCVIKTQGYGSIRDSGGFVESYHGTSVGCEKSGKGSQNCKSLSSLLLRNRGWRDSYFNFRDQIEILFPSVSFLETRTIIFSLNLRVWDKIENFVHFSGFETRSRISVIKSWNSRQDRDYSIKGAAGAR